MANWKRFSNKRDRIHDRQAGAAELGRPPGTGGAVKRRYYSNWIRLEPRLRSCIAVFVSLFDDNPAVARAFCPPNSDPPKSDQKRGTPLPPLNEVMEAGKVLALNFPISLNPGVVRTLGVMLKLDFQRAVLRRIAKINAASEKTWRDLLFVCDEYHTFATTGDTDPSGTKEPSRSAGGHG